MGGAAVRKREGWFVPGLNLQTLGIEDFSAPRAFFAAGWIAVSRRVRSASDWQYETWSLGCAGTPIAYPKSGRYSALLKTTLPAQRGRHFRIPSKEGKGPTIEDPREGLLVHMRPNIVCACKWQFVVVTLCALALPSALARNAPLVSGSYQVVRSTILGSQEQIRMRIHLVNRGPASLAVQRMILWDFSHPAKGGTQVCTVALRAHSSAVTTQEFTIQRSEYELWQRGLRPRLVLEVAAPGGSARLHSKTVLRLDREPGQEGK
jgi:hypothetical protein